MTEVYDLPSVASDGGPWCGPTEEEWVERIAAPSTPVGESVPWIKTVNLDKTSCEEADHHD
jgi:hypothetical protein